MLSEVEFRVKGDTKEGRMRLERYSGVVKADIHALGSVVVGPQSGWTEHRVESLFFA